MRRPGYFGDLADTWFGNQGKSSQQPPPSAPPAQASPQVPGSIRSDAYTTRLYQSCVGGSTNPAHQRNCLNRAEQEYQRRFQAGLL